MGPRLARHMTLIFFVGSLVFGPFVACRSNLLSLENDDAGVDDGAINSDSGLDSSTPSTCGDNAVKARLAFCRSSSDETSCTAAGGAWSNIGTEPHPLCICPTGEESCPCTRKTECTAGCGAILMGSMDCKGVEQATCMAYTPYVGCYCMFDAQSKVDGICID